MASGPSTPSTPNTTVTTANHFGSVALRSPPRPIPQNAATSPTRTTSQAWKERYIRVATTACWPSCAAVVSVTWAKPWKASPAPAPTRPPWATEEYDDSAASPVRCEARTAAAKKYTISAAARDAKPAAYPRPSAPATVAVRFASVTDSPNGATISCTANRAPATAPDHGRIFSNVLSGMVRSSRWASPATVADDSSVDLPAPRPPEAGVPDRPGTVPGCTDTHSPCTPH